MGEAWSAIFDALSARIRHSGLDLATAGRVERYNTRVAERAEFVLPTLRGARDLVVVIANTRRLWPVFRAALREDARLRTSAHPLDDFCRAHIERASAEVARRSDVPYALRFAPDKPPAAVALQHLAEATGLAQTGPSGLSIHPQAGPWIGLRAAAVFGVEGPADRAPPRPCDHCRTRPCMPAFRTAMEATLASLGGGAPGAPDIATHRRLWLAVRDACPVGREHRYDEAQLDYHYRKDKAALLASVDAPECAKSDLEKPRARRA